ncbi:hypothetical protein QR98_0056180 [Sarcoptes scabiei]|uniref:Platelet-derived growth factor receptor-like protein n=1 Tax=Sarcoptes scabiei TaxID=52283 RepID=A0A132A837_SARSC|nr:hypothetical protein QR98_0056180 [Sarcoptes scabiei]
MTGYFNCSYNSTSLLSHRYLDRQNLLHSNAFVQSVYIFVNDPQNLIVPYESAIDYLFIAVFQSQPATIPCRPSYSDAIVTLWKVHTKNNIPEQIEPNENLGISYDPKKGFHFEHPRWDSETTVLECRFKVPLIDVSASSRISLHWSILPFELHPIIDDTQAKSVFINQTLILKCFVHIDIGVIIVLDWDIPNRNRSIRVIESKPETYRELVNNNSYDTVSINLTVFNVTLEDQGVYRCNATDGHGRIFSASKKIFIHDENLTSSINFTSDFNNEQPIITDFGHPLTLTVLAHAYPDISFIRLVWYKDGRSIDLADTRFENSVIADTVPAQIILKIRSLRVSDSGIYLLQGVSTNSISNFTVTIYVRGDSEIVIEEYRDFYKLNDSYEIYCKSFGYSKITEIRWYWFPCETPESCLRIESENEINWENVTSSGIESNSARTLSNMPSPYMSVSTLKLIAHSSGIYRCSSFHFDDSHEPIAKFEEISFVVMDSNSTFSFSSSTEEPTVDDTVVLTCKASFY